MNGNEVIKSALEMSRSWLTALVQDVKDAPTTFPTGKGGNHPLWAVGHITHSEAGVVSQFVFGEANPLAKWDALFGMGSEPVADASAYPPLDELLAEFDKVRARTMQLVDSYTEADLSKPSHAPEEYKDMFGTVGQCLVSAALHATFHTGQIADARRAMGKKPVFG